MAADRPTVFLVDDHGLFRAGVRSELEPHCDIVGEADSVASAVAALPTVAADVVLLDVHLPDGSGADVCRQLLPEHPELRFLALSVSDSPDDVIDVVRAGSRGYVTKTIGTPELLDAIQRVAAGDAVFSPRLAGFVLDAFAATGVVGSGENASGSTSAAASDARGADGTGTPTSDAMGGSGHGASLSPAPPGGAGVAGEPDDEDLDRLTPREREVMRFIARGYTYREVAAELVLSVKTIETHVSAVLRKLQLSNRRELTRWAQARRIV